MSKLGVAIRTARITRHMSIGDLSQQSGAHPGMIGKLERGYLPSRDTWLSVIGSALDFHDDYLSRVWEKEMNMNIVQYSAADVGARYRARLKRDNNGRNEFS
jgi:ribosome-binding protein aMBF1 (putative translation factor)